MKNKILEVQNYFINKITACEFEITKFNLNETTTTSYTLEIVVDKEFEFRFFVSGRLDWFSCNMNSFMQVNIPNDRLLNLIALVESKLDDIRTQKIESLKLELEKLQTA